MADTMLLADQTLSRRLEGADAWFKTVYARAQVDTRNCASSLDPAIRTSLEPITGTAVAPIADGYAVYVGPGSPLNRAAGLGMQGPVAAAHIQQLEDFFRSRDAPVRLELCPLADPSLKHLLNERDYRIGEFKNVWVRPLRRDEPFPAPGPRLEVRPARPEEAALWIRTVSQGFAGRDDLSPAGLVIAIPNFYMPTATCFLTWVEGQPAGAGVVATHEGLAALFSASTRPAFRGQGVQTALLRARLAAAAAAGCDLATVQTVPGSPSQRNVQRAGFQLAYTRVEMVQKF